MNLQARIPGVDAELTAVTAMTALAVLSAATSSQVRPACLYLETEDTRLLCVRVVCARVCVWCVHAASEPAGILRLELK